MLALRLKPPLKSLFEGGFIVLDVVHGCDRFLGILLLGVSHESETAASAGISILNDDLDAELVRSDTSDIVCGK
jgi:hypothetical protein